MDQELVNLVIVAVNQVDENVDLKQLKSLFFLQESLSVGQSMDALIAFVDNYRSESDSKATQNYNFKQLKEFINKISKSEAFRNFK